MVDRFGNVTEWIQGEFRAKWIPQYQHYQIYKAERLIRFVHSWRDVAQYIK